MSSVRKQEEMTMPLIKVTDLAYGRLRAPDLDTAEEFLTNFGMVRSARTNSALYMRGTDPAHHLHVTEKGDPGFVGLAYGIKKLKPIPVKRQPLNLGADALKRAGKVMRIHQGPARVKRIGHGVMASPKVVESARWFRETLGFICSDDVYAGSKDNIIGSFNRLDRGRTYVDHHVYFCVRNERAGLNHLSFEVADIDDVFTGHEHLKKLGKYEHMWGIGRHLLGSQIYDYWSDPWGRVHEHWSDTDRLNTKNGSNLISAEEGLLSQWGERPPERFLNRVIA